MFKTHEQKETTENLTTTHQPLAAAPMLLTETESTAAVAALQVQQPQVQQPQVQQPKVQLRQVSWYKRRRPDPLEQQPHVQHVQVADFQYMHNSSCHVRVGFVDGRQLALVGRVLLNQQNGRWAIQALSAMGDQIILDVLDTPFDTRTARSNNPVGTPALGA